MIMGHNSLDDFLKHTLSQKEVSLVIARDETELERFREILEKHEFRQAVDTTELFKYIMSPSKVYFTPRHNMSKNVYDFVVQYSTGQVEIFNADRMKSEVKMPIYKDVSVVLLLTAETLKNTQKEFPVLETVGITYQS